MFTNGLILRQESESENSVFAHTVYSAPVSDLKPFKSSLIVRLYEERNGTTFCMICPVVCFGVMYLNSEEGMCVCVKRSVIWRQSLVFELCRRLSLLAGMQPCQIEINRIRSVCATSLPHYFNCLCDVTKCTFLSLWCVKIQIFYPPQ